MKWNIWLIVIVLVTLGIGNAFAEGVEPIKDINDCEVSFLWNYGAEKAMENYGRGSGYQLSWGINRSVNGVIGAYDDIKQIKWQGACESGLAQGAGSLTIKVWQKGSGENTFSFDGTMYKGYFRGPVAGGYFYNNTSKITNYLYDGKNFWQDENEYKSRVQKLVNKVCNIEKDKDWWPNVSTVFYGDCDFGEPVEGIVLYQQSNEPYSLSCYDKGHYKKPVFINQCEKYIQLLPGYCKQGDYLGQCKNGRPHGVGIKTWNDGNTIKAIRGQFKNGVPDGYINSISYYDGGLFNTTSDSKNVWYEKGTELFVCDGGVEGCRKHKIEYAKGIARQQEASKSFNKLLSSKKPQEIYISAGKYETAGEKDKAVKLYETIIERFPNHDLAVKSTDRLVRIKDSDFSRRENSLNNSRACESNRQNCMAGCESLDRGQQPYYNCKNRCDNGYNSCM